MATITGGNQGDTLSGDTSDDLLLGLGGDDSLSGLAGNDTLDGGGGDDVMIGGYGDDVYYVDANGDVVSELEGGGNDTVRVTSTYTLAANVENLCIDSNAGGNSNNNGNNNGNGALHAAGPRIDATGNSLDNTIYAGAGNNVIDGQAGRDTVSYLNATSGVIVSLAIAGTQDTFGSGQDSLISIENLTGSAFNDQLTGDAAGNVLDGGLGSDLLTGGAGDDTYIVDNPSDVIDETSTVATEIDTVVSSTTWTLGNNLENLILTGTMAIDGTGNALDNVLTGNAAANLLAGGDGNDSMDGGGGADTLSGGAGDDTIRSFGLDFARLDGGAGVDTLAFSGGGLQLALATIGNKVAGIEALDLTGSGNNTITLTVQDVLALSDTSDTLTIDGNSGDAVDPGAGWTDQGISNGYRVFTQGLATLKMNTAVTVLDTLPPTISIACDHTALKIGETAALTFTLSEASTDFTVDDISVTGGTLSAMAGSGTSYTATFTPDANSTATASIGVVAGRFTDAAGNGNLAAAGLSISVDSIAPTVSIASNDTLLKTGDVAQLSFTLSEAASDFAADDIVVSGGTLSGFAGGGTSYTALFTPDAGTTATATIDIAAGRFTDAAGNGNLAGSLALTVDGVAPTIAISSSDTALIAGEAALLTFTLSESSTEFTVDDIAVNGGTLSDFNGSGASYTAIFTPAADSNAPASIDVAGGTFADAAGNLNTAASTLTMTVDTTRPILIASSPADDALSVAVASAIVLSFSEPIVVGSGSIVLSNGTGDFRAIDINDASQVTISGTTVTIDPTVDFVAGSHYSVQLSDGIVQDLAGNGSVGIYDPASLDFSTAVVAPSVINLWDLNGQNGFTFSGGSVSLAGDVNGDGFGDVMIRQGVPYVVFGRPSWRPFSAGAPLESLLGSGDAFCFYEGSYYLFDPVSSAGDVNGDGIADMLVVNVDRASVVFGRSDGFAPIVEIGALDGTNGFSVDNRIFSANDAGDVNGDGFTDVIIGNSREAYVIFGNDSGFVPTLAVSDLDGSNGFRIDGPFSVISGAGDVNGDGFDDVIVGSNSSRGAYVVFGRPEGFASSIDASMLDANAGFHLTGFFPWPYWGLNSAGDVNGDGVDDLVVGSGFASPSAPAPAYVIFGKTAGFASEIDVRLLDSSNGFRMDIEDGRTMAVSDAGDINGDGFDDLLIGRTEGNCAYLLYGKDSGFSSSIDLDSLDGNNGMRLVGYGISGNSLSSAGDVNGDGFADVIVGGDDGAVVFGNNFTGAVTQLGTPGDNYLPGTAAAESFVAGNGADIMIGGGGADVFRGGEGDDVIVIPSLDFLNLDGGTGTDTLALAGGGMHLTLASFRGRVDNVEAIDLGFGDSGNTLTLTALDVVNLSTTSNTLTVHGDAQDMVHLGDGPWVDYGIVGGIHELRQGEAHLLIDAAVVVGI